MSFPQTITNLINRFTENRVSYSASTYNEAQLRQEFLNPFFEALGWDISNRQGYAEAYKEVIHEDAIKIGTATKAPDYSFRVGGTRKFFVEAKKPFVNIKDDITASFQLRRYAWSGKLPLSILTDFEELSVYDCRIKPNKNDKASVGRILYIRYEEYEKRWDEIASIFSKDSILKGSFDKYAETAKGKKGTSEVDSEFLGEIERWRDLLARNIAIKNPNLSQRELNFSVQRTIDRLIFLRICEDRGIEHYGTLMALLNGENVYKRMRQNFQKADEIYNSGLFHFKDEKGRAEPPDTLTLSLQIDDKPLKDIIANLYYPESPYEFSVLPSDILGQVYEQFLGKVIRLTTGHQAKVEDKPEVKKAGGVFYTPTYIVDYIVKNTVGNLIEDKTPKQIEKIKILDPACGSGSFLIQAYQFLLDYHRDWYIKEGLDKNSKGKEPKLTKVLSGEWRLSTSERKKILLNNIHGVDIDSQAVEVTKLSLLLKVLEGENEQSLAQQMTLWHERALPDLENNIKCGNSLIGTDFYEGSQTGMNLFEDEEQYRINAFDWCGKDGFQEIMKNGGFDVVIGNPPYIRIQTLKEWAPKEVEYYKGEYKAASAGNYDIYVVFVEKGLGLLNNIGKLGYILPHKFFNSQYGAPLREIISAGKRLSKIVHFGDLQVFSGATTYTCLMFLDKKNNDKFCFSKVIDLNIWRLQGKAIDGNIPISDTNQNEWNFNVGEGRQIFQKLSQTKPKLGELAHLFVGLQTDADDVFILEEIRRSGKKVLCHSKATEQEHWFEASHLKPFLKGSLNIRRYVLSNVNKLLLFPYENTNGKSTLIPVNEYKKEFPLSWDYLLQNKSVLSKRNKGKLGPDWYGYVYKKNHTRFKLPKILVPSIATGACFAPDLNGNYYFVGSGGGGGGGYGIEVSELEETSPLYLLGILNSYLITFYLKKISTSFRGGYIALNRQYIEQLPIHIINFSSDSDKSHHAKMVGLVTSLLDLHEKHPLAKTDHEKTIIQRQIDSTDRRIDELVYELYGLTEEEIRIVEGVEKQNNEDFDENIPQ
jgi:type I restriction-modification system DNA methylase subunit